jgi:hypothetical protein
MSIQASKAPEVDSSSVSIAAVELSAEQREFVERLKRLYKADHQAEYLYLQAEVDSLWIQLEQAKVLNQAAI